MDERGFCCLMSRSFLIASNGNTFLLTSHDEFHRHTSHAVQVGPIVSSMLGPQVVRRWVGGVCPMVRVETWQTCQCRRRTWRIGTGWKHYLAASHEWASSQAPPRWVPRCTHVVPTCVLTAGPRKNQRTRSVSWKPRNWLVRMLLSGNCLLLFISGFEPLSSLITSIFSPAVKFLLPCSIPPLQVSFSLRDCPQSSEQQCPNCWRFCGKCSKTVKRTVGFFERSGMLSVPNWSRGGKETLRKRDVRVLSPPNPSIGFLLLLGSFFSRSFVGSFFPKALLVLAVMVPFRLAYDGLRQRGSRRSWRTARKKGMTPKSFTVSWKMRI